MAIVNISDLGDAIVIYFDTDDERINAYTLASTLVGVADAAKAANAALNLGYNIEVVVEAIGPGSFKAMLRAIYTDARNLFSAQSARAIVLSVVASFIYERACAVNHDVKVEISTTEVVVESGGNKLIIPRQVYDATRAAEKNPQFGKAIDKTLHSMAADAQVKGVGIAPNMESPRPHFIIPKSVIQGIEVNNEPEPSSRTIEEQCDLQIVKAILERSTRKWEFMWRGVRISAPVLDDKFYSDFFAHDITIAPGDELEVRLAIRQFRDDRTGIYSNTDYNVIRVFRHIPRMKQTNLLAPLLPPLPRPKSTGSSGAPTPGSPAPEANK